MCEVCDEETTRADIARNLAWLDTADAVNGFVRKMLLEKQALLDASPRSVTLWDEINELNRRCIEGVTALQQGLGQTRQ